MQQRVFPNLMRLPPSSASSAVGYILAYEKPGWSEENDSQASKIGGAADEARFESSIHRRCRKSVIPPSLSQGCSHTRIPLSEPKSRATLFTSSSSSRQSPILEIVPPHSDPLLNVEILLKP